MKENKQSKKIFNIGIIIIALLTLTLNSFAFSTELVKTNPAPVMAGDYADITLKFTNTITTGNDNPKTNVYFKIDKTDFIMPIDNTDEIIPKVNTGESLTRTYRVFFSSDLEEGYIDLPIIIGYDGTEIKKEIRIFIEGGEKMPELLIGQITTIPNELIVDTKNNKITINVQNLGDKDAELVKAELVIPGTDISPSYSYSLEDSASSIKAGEQNEFTFTIDIEEDTKVEIPATLLLRYRAQKSVGNMYETFEEEKNLTIQLTPSPYLIVTNVEQLDDFKIGTTENKLKITVLNDGLEDAEEVRVRIVPDISYPFIFEETTMYVSAKIKPQETASIIFTTEISKSSEPGEFASIVILESLVEENRYSREDIVSITTEENKQRSNSDYGYMIIGIVVLISVILGFNTWKKSNKKKK